MPSFPFRKRRASSASSARSSACLNNQQVANVIPPIPPIPGPFTAISLSKDTSPCNQAAMTTPDQMNHSNCSSDTLPPFLKSRQRSFDFGRIQAKVSSVRLRGKSEDPNSRSSGNSLNNPEYLERKYQSGSEQKSLSNRQIIRRSILPSRLTADLNLSIRNSLNSNLNKASGIIRSDQLGIQLHCSNSAESCDQTSDSSLIKPSQHSNSSASLNQKSSKSNLHQSFSLVSPDAVNLWPTKSSTNLSPASLPVTSGKDSVFLLRPNSIEIKTEDQDALKIASEPHSDILNNIAECSLSASTSNFSARVRPTPSPRCPQSLDGEYGPDPKPPFPDHHRPSPRRPILPSKLRALPRLDSYSLQVPKQPSATQSQSSLDSSDHHGPAQEDYDIAGEINSETDGVSSEESSPARGTEELANVCRPGVSHLIGEISLALTTSATSLSLALPNSSISAHFESQPIVSVTPAPEAPVDRARALRSAPPPSVKVSSTCLFPRRPSIGSRRSLSVADFGRLGTGGPSSMCASSPHEDFASASQKSLFNIGVESSLGSSAMPKEGLLKTISISESSPSANPEATSLLIASPSQSSVPFTHRRQSMYEMRLANDPPPYQDTLQGLNNAKHKILPREEEGREGLPKYSCSIHLEGWMPRKMEFRSPGVQAKDRAWKRQYIVLHGTMMRIYRSDPHAHPVPGNDDTYSYHHIQCPSSSPFLGSSSPNSKSAVAVAPPLHFHQGRYDSAPSTSLKEVAFAKASQLPTQHNSLQRVYTLQNAESGLAADYLKRKYTVRVRAEGEQFLLQAKDDRGVIDLIEALQAATNVSLDLDVRPLPKFITLPRRRRRRRAGAATTATSGPQSGREIGAAVIAGMIAEVEASHRQSRRARFDHGRRQTYHENNHAGEVVGDRMAEMLAEEQEAYLTSRN
ncbi:expressed protein [Phakopsora pachyrhizi]|uniref:Expressed protein n=1 Tax=Phakopsora pachyrhizi TaxID=170000 RepID=A0AAV0B753_PHAPC|nr:expressed protein [Phakopsora pachyrhizi]